jgi:phage-related minor tail protein
VNEVEIVVKSTDSTERGFASVQRNLRKMLRDIKAKSEDGGKDAGDSLARGFLGMMESTLKPGAVAIATGLSAQITGALAAGLASGAVKVAKGFGAALALLPAAALAGGVAIGALKLALSGMADALEAGLAGDTEKFNEAIKDMPPSAQAAAREIVGLRDGLNGLKASVQESFFAPLVGQIRPLAETYLPAVQATLSDVARGFGQAGSQAANLLQTPGIVKQLQEALAQSGMAVNNLTLGLGNLLQAFIPLVVVGASFLPQLTDGFGGATASLATFMQEAQRTGALRDFIQQGIDAIKSLIETGAQVVRILQNIGDIGRSAFEGLGVPAGGLLDTIERLTEKAAEFVKTGEGKSALGTVMELARSFAQAFLGTLQKVGEILAPIMPQIVRLLTSFANLKTAILDALAPAVQFVGEKVLPALTSIMDWLANNGPVLQGILIGLFTVWAIHAGIAAAATIAATWPFILIGIAIAALAALIITHWDTIKAATQAVWEFVLGVIQGVWNWISDNWPLLLAILTGPIGMAVYLIVTHWETIKGAAMAVWNWINDNWHLLLAIITGPIGAAVWIVTAAWQSISDAASAAKDWISDRVDDIVGFIKAIPERIGNIGSQIKNKITSGLGGAIVSPLGSITGMFRASGGLVGQLAHAGRAATGGLRRGLTMVGEHGRELVDLPPGSRVHGNAMTEGMLAGGGGGAAGTLVVDVRGDSAELVELLRKWIRAAFGGDVQAALGKG